MSSPKLEQREARASFQAVEVLEASLEWVSESQAGFTEQALQLLAS